MITRKLVVIDEEASVDALLDSYINGNKSYVLDTLKNDHPGLAVFFITEGIKSQRLSLSDVNIITNKLIDDRRELLLASE